MRLVDAALNVGVIVLVGSALIVSSLVVRREFSSNDITTRGRDVTDWQSYAERGHRIGPENSAVTVVAFIDFQCEFCSEFHQAFTAVHDEYPTDVALVYRHYPLPIHAHARSSALASECAADQGSFRALTDLLYSKQDSIGVTSWESFGTAASIPSIPEFVACIESAAFAHRLTEDSLAARQLNVTGTPTLLINERRISGSLSTEQLRHLVLDRLPPRTAQP